MEKLLKSFVKGDVDEPLVRQKYGIIAGVFGICCNLTLTVIKIIVGFMTGVVSISADAINNLSDMFSSVITILGFKISGKPADKEHPYGHGRVEYISGFLVSAFVIAIAFELFRTSISNIIHKKPMDVSGSTIIILVCAILLKFFMAYVYTSIGNIISSRAMRATATDSMSDCVTTSVALVSVIIKLSMNINIDGYASAIVSVFVMISGISSAMDTINMLLGEAPSDEVIAGIKKVAFSHEEILGMHDLRVHDYGPVKTFASFHLEIDRRLGFVRAHDIVESIEQEIVRSGLATEVTIHMDPIELDDEKVLEVRNRVFEYVRQICSEAEVHDFHVVAGEKKKLLFDVQFPYDTKIDEERFKRELIENLGLNNDYIVYVTIDKG